ncbi:MAG: 50S ribosomal protein L5 [Patescibacteria group bacterium]
MENIKTKNQKAYTVLKGDFGYKNAMQAPKIVKVLVSTGTGSIKDKAKVELVADRIGKITGQKPSARAAKKSIATFKSRQGDTVGYLATLRGARMFAFLDKLFNIAIPRTRDFKGLNRTAVDGMGNLTIGIKEHTIFPETADEELKNVFGLAVTIVTTAKNKKEAEAFFSHLGVPFKKA